MLKLIPIFVVFLGAAVASPSADQYFDSVIHAVGQELRVLGLDPAPLSNFNVRFGPQALAEAQFTRGNVTNLHQIRRKGACQGPKTVRGETSINCTLSLYPVLTQHQVYIRNGSAAYSLRSQGNVAESLIYVAVSGPAGGYPGSVKNYRVDRFGQITAKFAPFPTALNKYAKVLQDTYRNQVSTELFNILQQRYVYAISRAAANKPMPRQ
ncbi:hypothetical protein JTE90_021872 [Oedothorax gibbosus]|uniref:Uncharacterized protein n=1 Tax=Oedothorax gibbosus TaxID=931172 RepID=A0AAV6V0T9_9ARAC|nr:hypothetical protein JTE90_021872 [Oedothorax gibbosus]